MNDLISREAFDNALKDRNLNYEFERRGLPLLDEITCYLVKRTIPPSRRAVLGDRKGFP